MHKDLSPVDTAKYVAAKRAVDFVQTGMKLGLGTGSTAAWMVRCLAARVQAEGLKVIGVPTSTRTAELARELGLTIKTLEEAKWLDLTIDGADEFDQDFNLIKGGGAALLQEKIVAAASDQMIVITDAAKEVANLGAFPLPVEVIRFGWTTTQVLIEEMLIGQDAFAREQQLILRALGLGHELNPPPPEPRTEGGPQSADRPASRPPSAPKPDHLPAPEVQEAREITDEEEPGM